MVAELLIDEQYYYRILNLIREAKSEILLTVFHARINTTAKFCPVRRVFDSLIKKHLEKVFVAVIFAQYNTIDSILQNNKKAMEYLQENSVSTFLFKQYRLLHAKTMIIDKKIAVLGSHNLTKKSLLQSAETSILTTQENVVGDLRTYFTLIQVKSQLTW